LEYAGFYRSFSHIAELGGDVPYFNAAITRTLRVLMLSQHDTSEIFTALRTYEGPFEGVEIMLSQEVLLLEYSDATDDEFFFPPLALALREYARPHKVHLKLWESFIRKLLRRGADLHPFIPRNLRSYKDCLWQPGSHGTPLDELCSFTKTPAEAETVADAWLQILSSEGYDVLAYLQKEMELHSTQSQLTFPSEHYIDWEEGGYFQMLRALRFILDETGPRVYWDWWVDPESSMDLGCNEFTNIAQLQVGQLCSLGTRSWARSTSRLSPLLAF
jgi:hypothetical protein